METPKAIRRAQIALIKQAEAIASEKKISFSDAMLSVIETPSNPEQVIKAFTKLPVSRGQSNPEKAELESYFDAAS